MDILRILAINNDRKLKETTVSSVLNYFLDPNEDHGMHHEFLARFIGLIIDKSNESFLSGQKKFWLPKKNEKKPIVKIYPEYKCDVSTDGKPDRLGSIDSMISIEVQNKKALIGVEVKIREISANNFDNEGRGQLERYALSLHNEQPDADDPTEIVTKYLVYLIPEKGGYSKKQIEECQNTIESDVELVVCYWGDVDSDDNRVVIDKCLNVSEIFQDILKDAVSGKISPPSDQALSLLRSLQNSIFNDFSYAFSSKPDGKFPLYDEYYKSLEEEQQTIFNTFNAALEKSGRPKIRFSPLHTSVGIPYKIGADRPKGNNSLFRIPSVEDYDEPSSIQKDFRIQLNKGIYSKEIESLVEKTRLKDIYEIKIEGLDNSIYHQNGKENEEVLHIRFEKNQNLSSVVLKEKIDDHMDFIKELESVFERKV